MTWLILAPSRDYYKAVISTPTRRIREERASLTRRVSLEYLARAPQITSGRQRRHKNQHAEHDDRAADAKGLIGKSATDLPAQEVARDADRNRDRDGVPEQLAQIRRQVRRRGCGDDQEAIDQQRSRDLLAKVHHEGEKDNKQISAHADRNAPRKREARIGAGEHEPVEKQIQKHGRPERQCNEQHDFPRTHGGGIAKNEILDAEESSR